MLKGCVVIFVFTPKEAQWAADYKLKHQRKMVKILAPTIPAQLVLKENGLDPFEYFQKELHALANYRERLQNLSNQSDTLWRHFMKHFSHDLTLSGIPLLTLLELPLRLECMVALAAYHLYRQMEKVWRPTLYLIPNTLTIQPTAGTTDYYFAPAAYIGRWFEPANKVRTYTVSSGNYAWIQRIALAKVFVRPHTYIVTFLRLMKKLSPNAKELRSPLDVLWYSFGYNLDYYREVFAHLATSQTPPNIVVVTGKQTIEGEWLLIKHRIPFVPLADLITPNQKHEAQKAAQELSQKLNTISLTTYEKALPSSLQVTLRKVLAYKIQQILKSHGTRFALHTVQAVDLVKKYSPKLVITTHDPAPSAIPFVHAAKEYGSDTLLLLHGIIDELAIDSYYKSNHIALWGPWMKRLLKRHPCTRSEQKFHTIGFPMLDPLFHRVTERTLVVGTPLHLTLLFSQYNPETFIISKFLTELFEQLAKASFSVRVTARIHREQSSVGFKELAKASRIPFTLDNSSTLEACIEKAHVVLSMDTTAILWPMILHKPLLYTTAWWGVGLLPVKQHNAAWMPNNPIECLSMLEMFHKDPSSANVLFPGQTSFIQDYLGVVDGTSSEKLLSLIHNLTRIKTRNNKHNIKGVVVENDILQERKSA